MHEVDFSNKTLSLANFAKAQLPHAHLHHSCLEQADLSETDLRYSDLENANLTGANLFRADLSDANLAGTILTNIRHVTAIQLSKAKNLEYAVVRGADGATKRLIAEALAAQFELILPVAH